MAAINYKLILYEKIVALLNSHAPTAGLLRDGNKIIKTRGRPDPEGGVRAKQVADFPRIYLRDTGGTSTAFARDPALSTMDDDFDPATCPIDVEVTQNYELEVVHEGERYELNSAFEVELLTALMKGGAKWGLSYVTGWTPNATRETTDQGHAASVPREVAKHTIAVTMLFTGAELIA